MVYDYNAGTISQSKPTIIIHLMSGLLLLFTVVYTLEYVSTFIRPHRRHAVRINNERLTGLDRMAAIPMTLSDLKGHFKLLFEKPFASGSIASINCTMYT